MTQKEYFPDNVLIQINSTVTGKPRVDMYERIEKNKNAEVQHIKDAGCFFLESECPPIERESPSINLSDPISKLIEIIKDQRK